MSKYHQKIGPRFNKATKALLVLMLIFLLLLGIWFHFLPFQLYLARPANSHKQDSYGCTFLKTSEHPSVGSQRPQLPTHHTFQAYTSSGSSSDNTMQYSSSVSPRTQHSKEYLAFSSSDAGAYGENSLSFSSYESAEEYTENGVFVVLKEIGFPGRSLPGPGDLPRNDNGSSEHSTTPLLPHDYNKKYSSDNWSTRSDGTVETIGEIPDKIPRNPNGIADEPNSHVKFVDNPGDIPSRALVVPDATAEITDKTEEIPNADSKSPHASSDISDAASRPPDTTAATPSIQTPARTSTIPGGTTKIPGTKTKIPDTATKIPVAANKVPDTITEIPGATTKIPNTFTEIPDIFTEIPDTTTSRVPDITLKTPPLSRHLHTTTNHRGKKTRLPTPGPLAVTRLPPATSAPPKCILRKSDLLGPLTPSEDVPSLEYQSLHHPELSPGGHYHPPSCRANQSVAIIIPYRDRLSHLTTLLYHLHPLLQRQKVDYTIFVVEQVEGKSFNRAMVRNIGAKEALKMFKFSCFIFHDVDLIPLNDYSLYNCYKKPRHMSVGVDTLNFGLPYEALVGGVLSVPVVQFLRVNGYSNEFWGWGGEDDDLYSRFLRKGLQVLRFSPNTSRYHMLRHKKDKPNPWRYNALQEGKKFQHRDGINSLQYTVRKIQLLPLYTWIYVDF